MDVTDVLDIASAIDANVTGAAILRSDREAEFGWSVVERLDGIRVRLDTADGRSPTQAVLDAIMSADLSSDALGNREIARIRAMAGKAMLFGATPDNSATRAAVSSLFTGRNDLAEGLYALLVLLCERLSMAVPSDQELADCITRLRNGSDPGVSAINVASNVRRRLGRGEILGVLSGSLASGQGDPLS